MAKYNIYSMNEDVQAVIKTYNIDKNKNGKIDEDNGELQELLSRNVQRNLDVFYNETFRNIYVGTFSCIGALGGAIVGGSLGMNSLPKADFPGKFGKCLSLIKVGKSPYNKVTGILAILGGLLGAKLSWYSDNTSFSIYNPQHCTQTPAATKTSEEPLEEYIPQRGEYWISILKAKYGVDDATALVMSHKIKDMIYDDSLAAKQSPVMYLPKVWNFNGKTYYYNDNTDADIASTHGNVKTEMGKMSPDLKYE